MLSPYSHKHGQRITTDSPAVACDRAFLAHFQIPDTKAPAASSNGIHAAMNLSAVAQAITTGITNPAVARNIRIAGNVAGINGKVKITGTNYAGKVISEELTANGTTAVDGALAFKTVSKIDLPLQVHTPVAQVETATVVGTITTAGNASVTVTSALFEADEEITVAVALNDNASAIAGKMRTALAANANISAHFAVSGATDKIILTAKVPAANDTTLNIAIANDTSAGITDAASSANTTAGVVTDSVSVGWGDIFGLPYLLTHNTVLKTYYDGTEEATAPTVVVDVDELEKNTIDINSSIAGKQIDIYLIV